MHARRSVGASAVALALLAALAAPCAAAPRVAVLPLENRSGDPRYDYIGGIAQGLILYDLSSSGAVELVDRDAIDALLRERELSLSGIAAAPAEGFEGVSAADYVLAGEYAMLRDELLLTLKLIDVRDSRVTTFSDAGSTENLVHGLVEDVVERLSGARPAIAEPGRSRSILSLRDETPGTIALFSGLVDARVTLDGEFIGYTTGDRRVPFIVESVAPGVHELSTDLGADFGVIILPEIRFERWRELVKVQSGRRATVVDESAHFNDGLYRLRELLDDDAAVAFGADGAYRTERSFSFVDRGGVERRCAVVVELRAPEGGGSTGGGTLAAVVDGERAELALPWSADAETEASLVVGIVEFTATVDARYGRVELELEADRADVEQGMHRARP